MPRYGYIRLDAKDPDVARQASQLDSIGKFDRIFVEQKQKNNSSHDTFEQLEKLLGILQPGDLVFAASLDRFCKQIKDFLELVEGIIAKGADFVSLEESFDTRSAMGRNTLRIIRSLESIDKETMSARKKEGIKAARQQGRRIGRPPVSIPAGFRDICREWSDGKLTGVAAIRKSRMKSTSFYKKAAELGYTIKKNKYVK